MRITCPLCGARDLREFSVTGSAALLNRPEEGAELPEWDDYLHNRDNPAGPSDELWYHSGGCGAWLVVRRDTTSHAVLDVRLASEQKT
ncbi:sarcosine oxidase subunit delta [Alphaproteobacteria bacterium KMM 3653]|uniref:Sarcosine oxidase subunit delta n=1 Tax=Harenicola maris TaxID=2841044 RepID=A0AAP2CT54_9RHOB|nr:sarcosine oxidase subunit delta [Harenicola maris]